MPIKYKMNIVIALKEAGYNSTVIRQDKIMGQRELQKLRHNELISQATIETICRLLNCQPGDIIEYIPDNSDNKETQNQIINNKYQIREIVRDYKNYAFIAGADLFLHIQNIANLLLICYSEFAII